MNSRKIIGELTQALASSLKQSQQQIELDTSTSENIEQQVEQLLEALNNDQDYAFIGQDLISHIFTMHPNIAHIIPRDLIWLLGGPCLHYMSDEELDKYNELDQKRFQADQDGEEFDWVQQKSAVFKMH
jgi:hypothetical protein